MTCTAMSSSSINFQARRDIVQFHAGDAFLLTHGVSGDLAVDVGRRAEVVAARSDAARIELLFDHPVGQAVDTGDARAQRAKRRVQIFIAKSI